MDFLDHVSSQFKEQNIEIEDLKNKIKEITSDLQNNIKISQQRDISIRQMKDNFNIAQKKVTEAKSNESKIEKQINQIDDRAKQIENRIEELMQEEHDYARTINEKKKELERVFNEIEDKKLRAKVENDRATKQFEERKAILMHKFEEKQTKIQELYRIAQKFRIHTQTTIDDKLNKHTLNATKRRDKIMEVRKFNEELAEKLSASQSRIRFEIQTYEKELEKFTRDHTENQQEKEEEFKAEIDQLTHQLGELTKNFHLKSANLANFEEKLKSSQELIDSLANRYEVQASSLDEKVKSFKTKLKENKRMIVSLRKDSESSAKQETKYLNDIDSIQKSFIKEAKDQVVVKTNLEGLRSELKEKILEERKHTEEIGTEMCNLEQNHLKVDEQSEGLKKRLISAAEELKRVSNEGKRQSEKLRQKLTQIAEIKKQIDKANATRLAKPRFSAVMIGPGSAEPSISEEISMVDDPVFDPEPEDEIDEDLETLKQQKIEMKALYDKQIKTNLELKNKIDLLRKSPELETEIKKNISLKEKFETLKRMQEEIIAVNRKLKST